MKGSGFGALGALTVLVAACGGSAPPPQTGATSTPASAAADAGDGVMRPITQGQLKCAHYATGDGVIGLVLDRTGDHAKVQVDGEKDIVELTMEEDRHFGERRGWLLKRPDGRNMLYLTVDGGLSIYKGPDELHLNSDKAANPLGAATVAGQYVEPTPDWKIASGKLTPIAVRTKFTQFKPEDAASVAKIGDVIGLATADMFVHFSLHGQNGGNNRQMVPQNFGGIGFGGVGYTSDDTWDPKAGGLAKYGGKNEGFSHYDTPKGNHMQVMVLQGYKPALAEGTPGLVWETTDGPSVVFVTLDGARWIVGSTQLDPGAGPASGWPKPAQDPLLDVSDVSGLVKAGALPQQAVDDLLAQDQEWTQCAAGVWQPVVKLVEGTSMAGPPNTMLVTPSVFTEGMRKEFEQKARKTCGPIIKKQEGMLVKLVEARMKDRLALMDKAKARVQSLNAP